MKKLGLLVGEENWAHFRDVARDLSRQYQTSVYRPRAYSWPVLGPSLTGWARRREIRRMLRRNDVCLFEWASDLLATASQLPRSAAVVTRLHSFELYAWAPLINWASVDRVIVVSEAMRRLFSQQHTEHAAKVVVVPNGVSLDRFQPGAQRRFRFRLGMLCGVRPVKRVYEVVLVLHEIRRLGHPAHLHIGGGTRTGDERYAAAVRGLVTRLRLAQSVTFHGHVGDPSAWLREIDIFISNSYWEGQQVALLEAMASGCYCLSHGWLGADEVLPAGQLYMTDRELATKILEYAEQDDAEQDRRRRELRALACEKFDIEQTKRRVREALQLV